MRVRRAQIFKFRHRLSAVAIGLLLAVSGLAVAENTAAVVDSYAGSSANGAGAVASVHPLATKAGLDVLEKGGNAIDAAVAVALTLGVVDSHNSGIGGGAFALVHFADGDIAALDGREVAPALAHRDRYLRDGSIDTSLSKIGALAIAVPGSLAIFDALITSSGRMSLKDLLLPAADLAEQGFAFSVAGSRRLQATAASIAEFPTSAAILLDSKAQPWPAGHILKQADLAKTYRAIAEQGIEYFYSGGFAEAVDEWMKNNNGLVRLEDFANYQWLQRQPLSSQYRGYEVIGFPPPSSGGVHVAQILNMLGHYDIAKLSDQDRYHLLAEAMKIAFADRAFFLGDPGFVDVPKGLIDVDYARQLTEQISFEKSNDNIEHGKPPGADIDLFGKHTTHISTADKWGNWVSITTTVNTSFGSKVIIPGTGVVMNNQMDDFAILPKVANAFGLLGGEANNIQAGKRPLSSMSPTLLLKDGKPVMSLGAAGGPTIITQVVQALVNWIDLGMDLEQALAAARIHHQWQPDVTFIEQSLADVTKASLQQRGHKLHSRSYMGATQAISLSYNNLFEAVTEPRVILQNTPEFSPE